MPLTKLAREGEQFEWGIDQQHAFEILKKMLFIAPILSRLRPHSDGLHSSTLPFLSIAIVLDWSLPFHVFVDASDVAVGAVLMQEKVQEWFQPVYYASRVLSKAERNYALMTEREGAGMIFASGYLSR